MLGEGFVFMERKEAVAILKEMVGCDLGDLSWVSLQERALGDYLLQIGSGYDRQAIEDFIEKNNLAFEEDADKRYLVICKRQSTQ
ncbi:MAG: hypothetical protein M1490_01475 [Candidatus Bathyarchaeota archaeon]|nr:hypothetical protein [Candidatus Bathyarchaeota archaeon]